MQSILRHERISKEMLRVHRVTCRLSKVNVKKKKQHATGLLSRGVISARGSSTSRYSNGFMKPNRSFLRRRLGGSDGGKDVSFSRRSIEIEENRQGRRFSARFTVAKFSRRQEGRVRNNIPQFATTEVVHWTRTQGGTSDSRRALILPRDRQYLHADTGRGFVFEAESSQLAAEPGVSTLKIAPFRPHQLQSHRYEFIL